MAGAAGPAWAATPPRGYLATFDYNARAPLSPTAALQSQTDLQRRARRRLPRARRAR